MTDPTPDRFAALREPFPPELVGKLPKAGITLDYVGHGAVTHRLLEVDPEWSWEPMAYDAQGLPLFTVDGQGNPIAFWIRLTICGVTRLGCGTCNSNQFDAEKVLIGDALRNAAMRFGVALDLWIKGHAEDDEQRHRTGASPRKAEHPAHVETLLAAVGDLSDEARAELRGWLAENGLPDRPAKMDEAQATAVLTHVAGLAAQEPQDAPEPEPSPNPPKSPEEVLERPEGFDREQTARWLDQLDDVAVADLLNEYGLPGTGTKVAKRQRVLEHMESEAGARPGPGQGALV